jgi:hypothetical protein
MRLADEPGQILCDGLSAHSCVVASKKSKKEALRDIMRKMQSEEKKNFQGINNETL